MLSEQMTGVLHRLRLNRGKVVIREDLKVATREIKETKNVTETASIRIQLQITETYQV